MRHVSLSFTFTNINKNTHIVKIVTILRISITQSRIVFVPFLCFRSQYASIVGISGIMTGVVVLFDVSIHRLRLSIHVITDDVFSKLFERPILHNGVDIVITFIARWGKNYINFNKQRTKKWSIRHARESRKWIIKITNQYKEAFSVLIVTLWSLCIS